MEESSVELEEIKNLYAGETAWVLGSGGTLNHLHPEFFRNKLVVSTNLGPVLFGITRPQFVFSHYHAEADRAAKVASVVVTLEKDTRTRNAWQGEKPANVIFIPQDSYRGPSDQWNPNSTHPPRQDSLVYGSSSLHGAMHLAAYVGAAHIVMVGADCGILDGKVNLDGYGILGGQGDTDRILSLYERDHNRMKQYLVNTYGVTVYSLNPFINLNLEGHTFVGPDKRY